MSKAVAKKQPAMVTAINTPDFLEKVQNVLPKMIKPQHFVRVAVHAMNRNPKILECQPASVVNCLLDLAQCGLEPDGRNAHLIPYGKQCQLIVDWKGMVELARRSGLISMWKADLIYENDKYTINKGEVIDHQVDYANSEKRGDVLLAYSYVRYKDGTEDYEIMTLAEVEEIRKRSKAKDSGPWKTDRNEMIKKTVMRRHSKRLPQSPEMQALMDLDMDTPDFNLEAPAPREDVIQPIDPEEVEVGDAQAPTESQQVGEDDAQEANEGSGDPTPTSEQKNGSEGGFQLEDEEF